jgi:hypothetical protein
MASPMPTFVTIANAIRVIDYRVIDYDDGLLFIGADRTGDPLEVMARETPEGLTVFHAMPLRPSYRERYL